MNGNHMKHMLIGGAGILVVLLLAGVSLGSALPYAFVLACPLMMVAMMVMMNRGNGHGGQGGGGHDHGDRGDGQSTEQDPKAIDAQYRR
jgi:hypothetical protein